MAAPDPTGELCFLRHRPVLAAVAYQILGSVFDADDVVQDAWLRWSETDRGQVADPRAFLVTVTTRLAIDRLRRARVRRETYVGTWLPEPVATDPDLAEHAALAEHVELALLVVLEALSPLQRAVFVLREAFAYSFREIGEVLDQTEANCRQLYHRGKQRLEDARPRYEVSREEGRRVVGRFLAAAQLGDLEELEQLLLADVVSWSDGGGKITAARRPVVGRERVATYVTAPSRNKRFFDPVLELFGGPITMRSVEVNGDPALIVFAAEHPVAVLVVELAADGIAGLRTVVNPDKLVFLGEQLSRMETLPGSSF
jgi:RNA polymerase sigma-70 factor (TIGR02957 family)